MSHEGVFEQVPGGQLKTDQPIYLYLSTGPEALRVLTGGLTLRGPYRFASVTLKGLERRLDGIIEPDDPDEPVRVLEFQGQAADAAWYNLLTKMGLTGERHPRRDVQGIGVFLRRADVPAYPRGIAGEGCSVRAVYLDEVLRELMTREPDNPYVAVLAPLVIADDQELAAQAPTLWQRVRAADLPEPARDTLSEVLLFWFMDRFKTLTRDEVRAMLSFWTSIEETSGYQAIKEEGREEGLKEGRAEGLLQAKADTLTRLLVRRFGSLPGWAAARIAAADLAQLDAWIDGLLDARDLPDLLGGLLADLPRPADDPARH